MAIEFSSPDDMPWIKTEPLSVIFDAVKAYCPYARVRSPTEGKTDLPDALDWATSLSGGHGLVVLTGNLYLVADFYRYMNLGCNTF